MDKNAMRWVITTHLDIEDGFWTSQFVPAFFIQSDSEDEILAEYNEWLQDHGVEIEIDNFDDLLEGYVFDGETLVADRGNDFCGNVEIYVHPTVENYSDWCEDYFQKAGVVAQ